MIAGRYLTLLCTEKLASGVPVNRISCYLVSILKTEWFARHVLNLMNKMISFLCETTWVHKLLK